MASPNNRPHLPEGGNLGGIFSAALARRR